MASGEGIRINLIPSDQPQPAASGDGQPNPPPPAPRVTALGRCWSAAGHAAPTVAFGLVALGIAAALTVVAANRFLLAQGKIGIFKDLIMGGPIQFDLVGDLAIYENMRRVNMITTGVVLTLFAAVPTLVGLGLLIVGADDCIHRGLGP